MTTALQAEALPDKGPQDGEKAKSMIELADLTMRYPGRTALDGVSFDIRRGELFGLLGPNGSGKSTLMRILAGLLQPSDGSAQLDGLDVSKETSAVRQRLGVAFQAPSLDGKLTVIENMRFQGMLFGISGRVLKDRVDELMTAFRISDRAKDRVESLSGGLKRRVELAKTLLHKPPVLLLDEPSTGLDPSARQDFWSVLEAQRHEEELTIVVATHLMDEAERCGRVALLDQGKVVAVDQPEVMKNSMQHEVVTLETANPKQLAEAILEKMKLTGLVNGGTVRFETSEGMALVPKLLELFQSQVTAVRLGKPTLEDVFLARTGRHLNEGEEVSQ